MNAATGLDRRFTAALALSVGVHLGAMMLSLPAPKLPLLDRPVPLSVQLVQEPVPPVAELTRPVRPAPTRSVRHKPAAPKHAEAPPATPQAQPPVETRQPEPAIEEAPASAPEPLAPPPIAALPPSASEPVAALTPAPSPRAPSAELLALYTKRLSELFARYKEYPRIAEMRGWEGSVTMRLRVAPSGRLVDAEVLKSSGHDALDQQAIAMVSKPGVLPVPPAGLNTGDFAVLLPIDFRLER